MVPAAPAPVEGVDQAAEVLRRIAASSSQQEVRAQGYLAQVNGHPALILERDGTVETVVTVRLDGGLITGLYAVRNPEKLSYVERETTVSR